MESPASKLHRALALMNNVGHSHSPRCLIVLRADWEAVRKLMAEAASDLNTAPLTEPNTTVTATRRAINVQYSADSYRGKDFPTRDDS